MNLGFVKVGNTFYNLDRIDKLVWKPDDMSLEIYYYGDNEVPDDVIEGIPATTMLKYMVRKSYTISDGEEYVRAD